jgi:hypothetical protein
MALDLYLRFRHAPPAKTSAEVSELSAFLGKMSRVKHADEATYRNANGVYMKMMNFRRFDSEYTSEGKVGLTRGNKEEESVWAEFSSDTTRLAAAVAAIRSKVDETTTESTGGKSFPAIPRPETPYWVFVCNPKKWAIDRFLDRRFEHDSWGIRPADRDRFAPGQLGIVRVGVDRRTVAERNGGGSVVGGHLCSVRGGKRGIRWNGRKRRILGSRRSP